jgi:hypothetical protein
MKWINIKDRLPKKGETVLLILGTIKNIHTGYYFDEIENECNYSYHVRGFQHSCENCELDIEDPNFDITHWMPLPKLPKKYN